MSYRDYEREHRRAPGIQKCLIASAIVLFAAGVAFALYVIS